MKTESIENEYDAQGREFLTHNGIKMRIALSNTKTASWQPSGNHYRVTLIRPASGVRCHVSGKFQNPKESLSFDFWGSVNDKKKLAEAEKSLLNMQLQKQNTEPHLWINLRDELEAREQAVKSAHPSEYDVLACISGDIHCPESFLDYCSEYGEDADSRKAYATFQKVSRFSKKLRAFLTEAEAEQLSEIR